MLSRHPGPHFITTAEAQPLSFPPHCESQHNLKSSASKAQLKHFALQFNFYCSLNNIFFIHTKIRHAEALCAHHPNPLNPFLQAHRSSTYNTQCISYTSHLPLHILPLLERGGKVESDRRNDQLTADKVRNLCVIFTFSWEI